MSHPMLASPCTECGHPLAAHGWLSGVCLRVLNGEMCMCDAPVRTGHSVGQEIGS